MSLSKNPSGHSGHNGQKCPDCGVFRLIRHFRYRCKPAHQAHLNPRIIVGERCNPCRIAWIKQDFKRIANARADQVISSVHAELWTQQLKEKRRKEKSQYMKEVWRTTRAAQRRERS